LLLMLRVILLAVQLLQTEAIPFHDERLQDRHFEYWALTKNIATTV
jgi:hypothetical protein